MRGKSRLSTRRVPVYYLVYRLGLGTWNIMDQLPRSKDRHRSAVKEKIPMHIYCVIYLDRIIHLRDGIFPSFSWFSLSSMLGSRQYSTAVYLYLTLPRPVL